MLTLIEKNDSVNNIRTEHRRLLARYTSFEKLQNKVLKSHCNAPEQLEDYMVWVALNQPSPLLVERSRIAPEEFFTYITPRRMDLLEYLASNPINSIKDLADVLERDYKNVYDDVMALHRLDLVEFIKEGKNRCPVAKVTKISIFLNKSL